ncbi:hypothetical protein [Pseudomonas paeninsulae]|uniref:hypothetical protein n=1 Tax=Pseudomonas paeninsulae TaxID=3110772 RepID=UPI002D7902FD|nr:hypothetical protein [Pseudomonas sp. IT1137]
MTRFTCTAVMLGLVLAAQVCAEPQAPQTIRVIPKTYISPGASGSIGGSQYYEQHNLYGGQRLPGDGVLRRYQSQYGSQSSESRGAIRQSIEYPGGYEVQTLPGQSSQHYQRSR